MQQHATATAAEPAPAADTAPDGPPPLFFPFVMDEMVGEIVIASIEGAVMLVAEPRCGWRIDGIVVAGHTAGDEADVAQVVMPRDHHQHDRLLLWLLAFHRAALDEAWSDHAATAGDRP